MSSRISEYVMSGPEFAGLSDKAFRLWVMAVCWQSKQRTDGWLTDPVARYLAGRSYRRYVAELLAAGLWEQTVHADRTHFNEYQIARSIRGFELWATVSEQRARPPIAADLRAAVYARDDHKCLHCGATERLTLDHIHPFSRGGKDVLANLQTLCRPCNSRKGAKV